jgi:hypothetical protein
MGSCESRKVLISIGLPKDISIIIDKKRGDVPRSTYLRKIIIQNVKEEKR